MAEVLKELRAEGMYLDCEVTKKTKKTKKSKK